MKNLLSNQPSVCALFVIGAHGLASVSSGHGGRYLGPTDSIVSLTGPVSPGPGPTNTGPITVATSTGPDLAIWDFWWGSNQHAFLNRNAPRLTRDWGDYGDFCFGFFEPREDPQRPSEALVRGTVVPALLKVLEEETNRDIVTGSLIALAKIGDAAPKGGSAGFGEVAKGFLRSEDQIVSETAALALGVLGKSEAVPVLTSLWRGDEEGQRLVGKTVPFRTRAFAGYALGLIGAQTAENKTRRAIALRLLEILETDRSAQPDLKVSAINALGIIPLDWPDGESVGAAPETSAAANRATLVRHLLSRLSTKHPRGSGRGEDPRIRAQYPIAIARLLALHDGLPKELRGVRRGAIKSLLEWLAEDPAPSQGLVQQSACIALGMIGNASGHGTDGEINRLALKALTRIANGSGDRQAKFFALMAIGQLGSRAGRGPDVHRELQEEAELTMLRSLKRGKPQEQAWAALALGVYGNTLNATGAGVPPRVVLAVRLMAESEESPYIIGSYAIALGLMSDTESQDELLGYLKEKRFSTDEARGHIAMGLGLMEATTAVAPINVLIRLAKLRPNFVQQAAPALGLLGNQAAIPGLIQMLTEAKGTAAQASIATALGLIGHTESIAPLTEVLLDTGERRVTHTARAYAAVALGLVCDNDYLPWNLKYSYNVNHAAHVETLANVAGTGILSIL